MKRAVWGAIAAAALSLAFIGACSAPTLDERAPFACAANGLCPSGFSCVDNRCSRKGTLDGSAGNPDASDATVEAGPDASDADAPVDAADAKDGDGNDGSVAATGVTVTPTSGLTVSETGTTATFTVVLNSAPTANVTIPLSSSNTSEATVSPASITFTPTNSSTPQTVTVKGVDDIFADGDGAWTIGLGTAASGDPKYSGFDPADVTGSTIDNEIARVVVSLTSGSTSESGSTLPFTVELNGPPKQNVTIGISSSNTAEGTVSTGTLIFSPTNWSTKQTVTVTGVADGKWDGDSTYAIEFASATSSDPKWSGVKGSPVWISNTDIDVAPMAIASVSTAGVQGNGHSGGTSSDTSLFMGSPSISSGGESVVFSTEASSIQGQNQDGNGVADIYRNYRSPQSIVTYLVTADDLPNPLWNGASTQPVMSADGVYLILHTLSTAWVQPGCVLREISAKKNYQMSTSTSCVPYDVSSDGRYALFSEPVAGVTTLKRFDRTTSSSTTITNLGNPTAATMSSDGQTVTFLSTNAFQSGDTNGVTDLYIADAPFAGTPNRISTKSDGTQLANGATAGGIAGSGAYAWFTTRDAAVSADTDADADVYIGAAGPSTIELASRMAASGAADLADISADGRYLAFEFTPQGGNKEVWIYDRVNQTNTSAHKTYNGGTPNGKTERPSISGDGKWLAFVSAASNLVASDTNGKSDVFILPRP